MRTQKASLRIQWVMQVLRAQLGYLAMSHSTCWPHDVDLSEKLEQLPSSYDMVGCRPLSFREVTHVASRGDHPARFEWLIAKYPELRPEHLHHPLIRNDAFWVRMILETSTARCRRAFPRTRPGLALLPTTSANHPETATPCCGTRTAPIGSSTRWSTDRLARGRREHEGERLSPGHPGSHYLPPQKTHKRDDVPNLLFSSSTRVSSTHSSNARRRPRGAEPR